jgi:hypothetical protein
MYFTFKFMLMILLQLPHLKVLPLAFFFLFFFFGQFFAYANYKIDTKLHLCHACASQIKAEGGRHRPIPC